MHAGSSAACGSSADAPPWAHPSSTTPSACHPCATPPTASSPASPSLPKASTPTPSSSTFTPRWRGATEPVDLDDWTDQYALRRYGASDPHARNAWRILLRTAYGYRADGDRTHGERDAAHESLFNAQPSLDATRTGHWAPDVLRYDAADLKPALTELLQVAPSLRNTAGYRYDLADIARQVLANDARRQLPLLKAAYEAHDLPAFRRQAEHWMQSMTLEDRLLATNEYFLLGRWLSYVPAWAHTPEQREQIMYDAKSILTTWGDRVASQDLHEYGNRDWAGLVSSYYAPRWQMYFQSLETALATGNPPQAIDWYAFGDAWNRASTHYNSEPTGDTYTEALAIATLAWHLHLRHRRPR